MKVEIRKIENGYIFTDRYGKEKYFETLEKLFEYLKSWF